MSTYTQYLFGKTQTCCWISDFVLLGARLYAGITIAKAGADKLPTPSWMVDQVIQIGFPFPSLFAFMACFSEFVFGILLAIGLMTPVSAFFLAFTLGVAAFGFHQVSPITGMHITQGFFWLFLMFMVVGPGRISIDRLCKYLIYNDNEEKLKPSLGWGIALGMAGISVIYGLYLEFLYSPPPVVKQNQEVAVNSISVPGSFNNWSLTEFPLNQLGDDLWSGTMTFDSSTPIQFKFAANDSWNFNLGDADQVEKGFPISGSGDVNSENIEAYIPNPGEYQFTVNTNNFEYEINIINQDSSDE